MLLKDKEKISPITVLFSVAGYVVIVDIYDYFLPVPIHIPSPSPSTSHGSLSVFKSLFLKGLGH
jgi:hypothetical protein